MQKLTTALSAFSARATHGRRIVLVGYSVLVTLAILGVSSLIAAQSRDNNVDVSTLALADMLSMLLVGAALFVVAPAMVSAQVCEERRQGTLDLLRTAPLSPTALTAGFLLGAPGTLYLLCVGPLALHVLASLSGAYPLAYLPITLLLFVFGSMATMLFAVVASMAIGREGGGVSPMLVGGALAMAAFTSTSMAGAHESLPWAFLHPAGGLAMVYDSFDGPFRDIFFRSWQRQHLEQAPLSILLSIEPALVVAFYFCASALLMSAARRLLASDPPSKLEKPTALALFALVAAGVLLPLRFVIEPTDFDLGTAIGVGVALFVPYFACVLCVTPASTGRAKGSLLSAGGAPHLTTAMLMAIGFVLMLACYGHYALTAFSTNAPRFFALIALALTAPIYSLWASTRIHSGAGRLAFWAFIAVHAGLQIPAIIIVTEPGRCERLPMLLSELGVAFGIALPLFLAWRQRRADRALC